MNHGSLFSGIGGFDLAADWIGWTNVLHCEINPFGQRILKHYWPNAISYTDIIKTDFTKHRGEIDILSGGFPCQPFSQAGLRKGTADSRHLWPEMLRAIREIQPAYVVGENVYGLINWSGGMVFDQVQTDLETEGYQVVPFLLPACGVDAPHRRYRVWFIAYSDGNHDRRQERGKSGETAKMERVDRPEYSSAGKFSGANSETITNASGKFKRGSADETYSESESRETRSQSIGIGGGGIIADSDGWIKEQRSLSCRVGRVGQSYPTNTWINFPTQPALCGGNDGLPSGLAGITFPKWRNESIKGYGNAIVPQVVYQIFKTIQSLYELNNLPLPTY